jgi:hypothetical protein
MDLKYVCQQYFICMCFLGFIWYNKTFIACGFRKYENAFTHEYHIPLGRSPREIWYSWVNKFSYFPHQHAINVYYIYLSCLRIQCLSHPSVVSSSRDRYLIQCPRRVSDITFIRYAQCQYIGKTIKLKIKVMALKATFNNISVISVEETGVPGENHRTAAGHWQTLSHKVVSSTPRHERDSHSQLCDMHWLHM